VKSTNSAANFRDTPPIGKLSIRAQDNLARIDTLATAINDRRALLVGGDSGSYFFHIKELPVSEN
jgi:hypothetical protein